MTTPLDVNQLRDRGMRLLRQAETGVIHWTDEADAAVMLAFVLSGLVEVVPDSATFDNQGVSYQVCLTSKGRAVLHIPRPRPCLYCDRRNPENCCTCGFGPHPHLWDGDCLCEAHHSC